MAHMNIKFQHDPYLTERKKTNHMPVRFVVMPVRCKLAYVIITVVFLTSNVKESPDIVAIAHDV